MSAKTKNIFSWVLSALLAAGFLGSGVTKLIGLEMQMANIRSWGFPDWTHIPIGLGEIVLGIGILIPRFRLLTTYGVFIWAVVAVLTHVQAGQMAMIGAPLPYAALGLGIFFIERSKQKEFSIA